MRGLVPSAGFYWVKIWWLREAKSLLKCKERPSGKAILRIEFISSESVTRWD